MASNNSPRASSIWPQMPFMRGPVAAQRLRDWLPQYRERRAEVAARRERVLAHEWARKQLCTILGLSDARNWNGYIPEARNADGVLNPYESRRALIELLREVAAADGAGQEPGE
ncbi:hypothetical protein MED01_004249 [Micromonospora sp. MED01]|uniref:hypothetical protein n=1 Tax=Micromonospora alfalfae TaxID=2911212 RepID=UPI001EE7D072|nr:hypothetical protein [Micromonospora alfalfae]MCG5460823.1 hypothetical protein [Micromonospora alfalfae]